MKKITRMMPIIVILTILLFVFIFFLLFGNKAVANTGYLDSMKGYESVLIKKGDTLSTITHRYAAEKSNFTEQEYMEAVISLNNLQSEYLTMGNYILLPEY